MTAVYKLTYGLTARHLDSTHKQVKHITRLGNIGI